MGEILFTSDLHFGHANVIAFDNRPFKSVEEMDEYIITKWNERVRPKDDVYILGDVCFKSSRRPVDYLRMLTGKKHLIIGNHDTKMLKDRSAREQFESVEYIMKLHFDKQKLVLSHHPMAEWDGFFGGAYHIYGHIHNKMGDAYHFLKRYDKALNAGCMINGYEPVTLEELIVNNIKFQATEHWADK